MHDYAMYISKREKNSAEFEFIFARIIKNVHRNSLNAK